MQREWYYISTTIQVLDKTSLLQDGADLSSAEKDDGEREGAVLVQKLPNELLGQEDEEEEGSMEPVVLVTAERERYSCVLPTSAHGGSNEVSATWTSKWYKCTHK